MTKQRENELWVNLQEETTIDPETSEWRNFLTYEESKFVKELEKQKDMVLEG